MELNVERHARFENFAVTLSTCHWRAAEDYVSETTGYTVAQKISGHRTPLKVGPVPVREVFPHVRSVAYLPPEFPLRLYPIETPMRIIKCTFDKTYFDEIARMEMRESNWTEQNRALVAINSRRLELLMQSIATELYQPCISTDLVVEAAGVLVAVEMARYGGRLNSGKLRSGAGSGLSPRQSRLIKERLDCSIELGFPPLRELAEICGISLGHLMRSFKVSTGWTLHQYIAEQRLISAKELLRSGKLTSKEIAATLGFANSAYFTTVFRRTTGLTPKEFRKQSRSALHN